MTATLRPRPEIETLPDYRPGRSVPGAAKLSSNELPWGPVPSVATALEAAAAAPQRYPDHRATLLRQCLAAHHGTTPEHVAVGAGAIGLLQQLAITFVGEGDEVVFGDPSFEAYPIFAQLAGGVGKGVALRHQSLDVRSLAGAVGPRTRLVLLANPNNPTGTAVAASEVEWLADVLPSTCLLVVDEAYREFVTGRHAASAAPLALNRPDVMVLRTFSKAHGLAALRVGWALGDPALVRALDRVLIPFSVGGLGQAAAVASLDARCEVAERVAAVVAERSRVAACLRESGWSVPMPEANFVWLPAAFAAVALGAALEGAGVVARTFPGAGVRVSVGSREDNDRFLRSFVEVAGGALGEQMAGAWQLPVADGAEAVAWALSTVDRAEDLVCSGKAAADWPLRLGAVYACITRSPAPGLRSADPHGAGAAAGATGGDDIAEGPPTSRGHVDLATDLDRLRALLAGLGPRHWDSALRVALVRLAHEDDWSGSGNR